MNQERTNANSQDHRRDWKRRAIRVGGQRVGHCAMMTAAEFAATPERMGISRRELCRRLGISKRTGDAYALGRSQVPRVVELAILALHHGLGPKVESADAEGEA